MGILIAGLVLFLGIHLLPVLPSLRNSLAASLGEQKYKGMFSIVSALGLLLIVAGYAYAPSEPYLFTPFVGARHIAPLAIPVALVLLAAANMRTHIRQKLKHPMLIGVGIWALVHLLANGELKATLLFGGFLAYAVIDLISASSRHAVKSFTPVLRQDLMAIGGGLLVALLVMMFHRYLFGVPAITMGAGG